MGEYRADLAGFRQPGPLREGDPTRLGPYRLLGRLGAGGMGVVFLGEDASGGRAAVKLPREVYAEDPVFRARFAREVAAAERVSGRFTAQVLGYSVDGERPWLATELVPGPSLREFVSRYGPLRHGGQRALAAGLAEALAAIHDVGLVHRDLKPSNVLCAPDGPRVIDFGIAVGGEASRLTQVGMVVGSPAWMAPEHMRGERVGPSADMFAWALLVGYAACGRPAFGEDGSPAEMLHRVLYDVPDTGSPEELAPDLRPLVTAALSKDADARPSAHAVCAALVGVPVGQPARATERVGELVDRVWSTPPAPSAGHASPVAAPRPPSPAHPPPASYPHPPGPRSHPHPLTPVGGPGGPRPARAVRAGSRAGRRRAAGRGGSAAVPSGRSGAHAGARRAPWGGPWPGTYVSRSYRRRRVLVGVVTALVAVALLVLVLSALPPSTPGG